MSDVIDADPAAKELIAVLRLAFRQPIAEGLADNFRTARERDVYKASDGEASSRDIGKALGIGHTTVARLWQRWLRAGLVERTGSGGYRALLDLTEFPDLQEEAEDGG